MLIRWNSIFAKTKKLLPEVKKYLSSHQQYFLKDEFVEVVDKASREKVRIEEYDFWVLRCFDKDQSYKEVVLNSNLMWKCLKEVIDVRSLDDVTSFEYVNSYQAWSEKKIDLRVFYHSEQRDHIFDASVQSHDTIFYLFSTFDTLNNKRIKFRYNKIHQQFCSKTKMTDSHE